MLRLFCFIIIFALFLTFIVLNLENSCDVDLGFHKFPNAPVYITASVSFFLGMLCTIPVLFVLKGKKHPKQEKNKRVKKDKSPKVTQDEIHKENGPYGID